MRRGQGLNFTMVSIPYRYATNPIGCLCTEQEAEMFQSLIGTLQTKKYICWDKKITLAFQSLKGTLRTRGWEDLENLCKECFNPL